MTEAKVLITFDDGCPPHLQAAKLLTELGLVGTFSVVVGNMETAGLSKPSIDEMAAMGHFVCNHSWSHPQPTVDSDKITEDAVRAKRWLMERGFHGDYYISPFGGKTIHGHHHLQQLLKEFKWIRTVNGVVTETGYQFKEEMIYSQPFMPDMRVVPSTAPGSIGNPDRVKLSVDLAILRKELSVLMYHGVASKSPKGWDISWEMFVRQMAYVSRRVEDKSIACLTPEELLRRNE